MRNIQSPFNWVNVLAVPMTAGILEAQPIVVVSTLVTLVFAVKSEGLLVVEGSSILLIWSLYWWALLARRVIQPRAGEQRTNLLYVPALLVSFAIIVAIYPGLFQPNLLGLFAVVLSAYLWRRGMLRVERDLRGESVMTVFHVGFFVLLLALLFAVVDPQPGSQSLLTLLPFVLLLFCLSGLIALSLTHLEAMRRAHQRRFTGHARTSPTRLWIQNLLVLLVVLAALMIVSGAATFQLLVALFAPLTNELRALIHWFLDSLRYTSPALFHSCLYQACPTPQGPSFYFSSSSNGSSTLAQVILVGSMSLLALFVLVILFWIVRRAVRGRKSGQNEDEVREHLPVRPTLKARKQNAKERQLERLDATSARFYYRAFLLAMARRGKDEQRRRPDETPTEYQARLLAKARPVVQNDATPTDAAILDTLTRAYTHERYGGKPPTVSQQAYLRRWISVLVKRLTSS